MIVRKDWSVCAVAVLSLFAGFSVAHAETLVAGESTKEPSARADYREEIGADKDAIKSQRDEMKEDSSSAREEEKAVREQIRAAEQAGDYETVKTLRAQLQTTHRENVEGMRADKKELGEARKELRQDVKAARTDLNKDGTVDRTEHVKAEKRRADRNKDGKVGPIEKQAAKRVHERRETRRESRQK